MISLETAVGRQRRRWRVAIYGSFVVGILGMIVGVELGYDLLGTIVYLVGVAGGAAICLYACYVSSVTIRDERFASIERRASHVTLMALVYASLALFPPLFVLEAAGRFEFGPALEQLLFTVSGLFLVWGAVYTVLRFRS